MVEKKIKRLLTQENDMKFEFHCPEIEIYGNIVTFIHLHIAYGWFHATRAKLTSRARDHMACQTENVYKQAVYRKVADPWFSNFAAHLNHLGSSGDLEMPHPGPS